MNDQLNDRIADATAAVGVGGGLIFGLTIGQINEYLQAGAFLVTIISGLAVTAYYLAKAIRVFKQGKNNEG